jgi:ADP-ribosyl-[dinitrogen reductase] hydrolase
MIDNTPVLKHMLSQGMIRLKNSDILYETPPFLAESFGFEKVEGMLLGLAIGDALGATTEGLEATERKERFGEIRDYLPGKRSGFRVAGAATDDTQLSFWTLEQLIDDKGLDPDNLARKFCKHRIIGIGGTTKNFVRNYKDKNLPWYKAGLDSLGNGALMRIAPIVLPYLRNPHPSLYADAALDSMITHNAFANNASCVAFVRMLWELLPMTSPPKPYWWIEAFCSTVRNLEGNTKYRPLSPQYVNYEGSLWEFTQEACQQALSKGLSVEEACDSWGSGANLFETVPSVLYILAIHGHDPEEAIVRAVNDTSDNDTIASIVGAAVGALHGLAGIPERWVKRLTGRIREGGGYQVFRLILHAKQVFWLNS